jgi:hypothetical protein
MNNIATQYLDRETTKSDAENEQKIVEGRLQLEDEEDARKRRVKLRKQRQAKLVVERRDRRRKRAFKLAGLWILIIAGGLFAATWYSGDITSLLAK